jgi:periplasmic protein TonB
MIRWLPLSLAVHVAALGGGVWLARHVDETALLVDLTLSERALDSSESGASAPAARARSGGRPASASPRSPATAPRAALPTASASPSTSTAPATSLAPAPSTTMPATSAPSALASAPAPTTPTVDEASPAPRPVDAAAPTPSTSSFAGTDLGAADAARASESSEATSGAAGSAGAAPSASGTMGPGSAAGTSSANGAAGGEGLLALALPGDGGAGAYGPYLTALRRRLHELLEYPPVARRRGVTGTVHLEIALEPTGQVSDVMVVRSSDHEVLDRAALDAARRLRRVPFPADVRPRALRVRLPVVFELR